MYGFKREKYDAMYLVLNRVEIDENTNLQQSLEHSYDDNARIKRDLDQSKRDAQQLASELESVKVFVILLYCIKLTLMSSCILFREAWHVRLANENCQGKFGWDKNIEDYWEI